MSLITIFMVIWIALAIGGYLLFYVSRDVRFKKKWFPWFIVFSSILFLVPGVAFF